MTEQEVLDAFKVQLWALYPIPETVSVYGGDALTTHPLADLDGLIRACVQDLRSDLYMVGSMVCGNMNTIMPDDCFAIISARLDYPFQGNRTVRFTFVRELHQLSIRYTPAIVTYRRLLGVKDLMDLQGDQFQYAKMYMCYRMATKEVNMLKAVTLDADNGQVNLQSLEGFASECWDRYKELKGAIFMYTGGA